MMVPRPRGATNTTLPAPRRHRCRHGTAAADCTRFRSCSETVAAPAALNNHQNLAAFTTIAALSRARGGGAPIMMALAARCELRGGARQPSGFNNSERGVSGHNYRCPLARARGWGADDDGTGGAVRATGWRATAIRFQQFGEGGQRSPLSLPRRGASYGVARDSHPVSTIR